MRSNDPHTADLSSGERNDPENLHRAEQNAEQNRSMASRRISAPPRGFNSREIAKISVGLQGLQEDVGNVVLVLHTVTQNGARAFNQITLA